MAEKPVTLLDLCKVDRKKVKESEGIGRFLKTQQESLKITTVPWRVVEDKIADKLVELFNIKLVEIMVGAWKEYRELQDFADSDKYPEKEEIPVPLIEHDIVSEHNPVLEIDVAGVTVCRLQFELSAVLHLAACELTIQGGRIKKILPGKCNATGTLSWKKVPLLKIETETVTVVPEITLGDGIPLASAEEKKAAPSAPKTRKRASEKITS